MKMKSSAKWIDLAEAEAYEFSNIMASIAGLGVNQKLKVIVKGPQVSYEVWDQDELVMSTRSIAAAVDSYNRL